MQGVESIVKEINSAIAAYFADKHCFNISGCKFYGVSQSVDVEGKSYPAVFVKDGVYVGVDDSVPFSVYHKTGQATFSESLTGNFGDRRAKNINMILSMTAVFSVNGKLACMTSDELLLVLTSAFPETLSVADYSLVNVKINSAILNPQQVFQAEYKGSAYFLKPEQFLLSVNYTIESRYKKGCFNPCN